MKTENNSIKGKDLHALVIESFTRGIFAGYLMAYENNKEGLKLLTQDELSIIVQRKDIVDATLSTTYQIMNSFLQKMKNGKY